MCVSDDVAGHKEALVAALFNTTFQVVCAEWGLACTYTKLTYVSALSVFVLVPVCACVKPAHCNLML